MSASEQRIRERAYHLWREAGSPQGRTEEFWFAAEREAALGHLSDATEFAPPPEPALVTGTAEAPVEPDTPRRRTARAARAVTPAVKKAASPDEPAKTSPTRKTPPRPGRR